MGLGHVVAANTAGAVDEDAIRADSENDPGVDEVFDVGVRTGGGIDHLDVGVKGVCLTAGGAADRGLPVCGTGTGGARVAGRSQGICAAVALDLFAIERFVPSRNAQVLAVGARAVGLDPARSLTRGRHGYVFDPLQHSAPGVAVIEAHEKAHGVGRVVVPAC